MRATPAHFAILVCLVPALAEAAEHPPTPAETAALTAPIHRLVAAINHADPTVPANIFTQDATVLDDFAPYRWSGPQNADAWYRALLGTTPQDHAAFLAMHPALSVGQPRFARITDDAAYLVLPGLFVFNTAPHKRVVQTSDWIITERLVGGTWLIAGHAWAINTESAASPN